MCWCEWVRKWKKSKYRRSYDELCAEIRGESEGWRRLAKEVMEDRDTVHQKYAYLQDVMGTMMIEDAPNGNSSGPATRQGGPSIGAGGGAADAASIVSGSSGTG